MNRRQRLEMALEKLAALAQLADCPKEASIALDVLGRLRAREWFVLLLGETSVGKTSMVNALLGEELLPVSADATTGVPVEIRFGNSAVPTFEACFLAKPSVTVTLDEFRTLCRVPGDCRRLSVFWPADRLRSSVSSESASGLVLVDAPGYNSCVAEHIHVLTDILPEADAVVFMLNFRRGVTPEDVEFFRLAVEAGELQDDTPLLAVNWVPPRGGERQMAAISRAVRDIWPGAQLHPLGSEDVAAGRVRPWSDSLWAALVEKVRTAERDSLSESRSVQLAKLLVGRVVDALETRRSVCRLHEESLESVREILRELAEKEKLALAEIHKAVKQADEGIGQWLEATRSRMRSDCHEAIEEAGRFTDARSCGAYISQHRIPQGIREAEVACTDVLTGVSTSLGERLDGLALQADHVQAGVFKFSESGLEERLKSEVAASAVGAFAEAAFKKYLARLGGAAGVKGGIVNLGKIIVSKTSRACGKPLSRGIYDSMGQVLKRFGVSASRASAAMGAAVLEVAAYGYHVVRWKKKLRATVDKLLGYVPDDPLEDEIIGALAFWRKPDPLPLAELALNGKAGFKDAMDATRAVVRDNFGRRREVLQDALDSRLAAGPEDASAIDDMLSQLVMLTTELDSLEGEL